MTQTAFRARLLTFAQTRPATPTPPCSRTTAC